MKHAPTIVQAVGTSIVAVSLFTISVTLGLAFTGVALVAFGIAAERS